MVVARHNYAPSVLLEDGFQDGATDGDTVSSHGKEYQAGMGGLLLRCRRTRLSVKA